jgi:GT2 family glycosyltransferase
MNTVLNSHFAILIIFFNKLEQTISCVQSFVLADAKIYVLNNGSNDKDFAFLKKRFADYKNIIFLNAGRNLGPSGGRNLLIENTKEPWLFFVDNDIVVKESTCLSEILNLISNNTLVDAFIPSLYNRHEGKYSERYNLFINDDILKSNLADNKITNNFPGGAVIINRQVFERYGLFDEKMFAFEDFEIAIRALKSEKRPLKCLFTPEVELIHDHRYQRTKIDKKAVRERYGHGKLTDSLLYLEQKHNVKYEHQWKDWTNSQIERMTKSFWQIKLSRLFNLFFKTSNK